MKDITNCPNCGAPLPSNGHCEYCGTVVKRNNDNIVYHKVVTTNRTVQKIACMQMIPYEARHTMTNEQYEIYVKNRMISSIADCIADLVVFRNEYDPIQRCEIVRATIGVADLKGV